MKYIKLFERRESRETGNFYLCIYAGTSKNPAFTEGEIYNEYEQLRKEEKISKSGRIYSNYPRVKNNNGKFLIIFNYNPNWALSNNHTSIFPEFAFTDVYVIEKGPALFVKNMNPDEVNFQKTLWDYNL